MKKLTFIISLLICAYGLKAQNAVYGDRLFISQDKADTLKLSYTGHEATWAYNKKIFKFKGGIKTDSIYLNGTWYKTLSGGGGTAAIWGNITGTLSNQTDLQSALDAKVSFPGFGITANTASVGNHNHTGVYQPIGSYLTSNQTITLSGDITGSGSTAITTTLPNIATAGTYKSVIINAKGQVTAGTNPTTLSGYGITDAQPLDGDLTSIAGLSGTRGLLQKSATNTFTLIGTVTDTINAMKFTRHPDVPQTYSGAANKVVSVNSSATGLQFSNVITTNNVDTAEVMWIYKNLNCKTLQSVQLSYSTNFTTFIPFQVKIAIISYSAGAGTIDPVLTIGNNATDYNNVLASYTLSSPAVGKIYTVDLASIINNTDSAPVFIKIGTASDKTTFSVVVILNGVYL